MCPRPQRVPWGVSVCAVASVLAAVHPTSAHAQPSKAANGDKTAAESAAKTVAFDPRWLTPYFKSGPVAEGARAFARDDHQRAKRLLAQAVRRLGPKHPERQPATYLLALSTMELGSYSEAGARFEALYEKYPALAPYHAHYAARCRLLRGDTQGALTWAAKVEKGTVLEAETILIEVDALRALEKWAEVEQRTADFVARFPSGPRRAEALSRQAEAMEALGRPLDRTAGVYRQVWAEAPYDAWSRKAVARLDALAAEADARASNKTQNAPAGSDLKRFRTAEWMTRAKILYDRNRNEQSEQAYAEALASGGANDPAVRCEAEFFRAQSVFKQRSRSRAEPLFSAAVEACRAAKNDDLYPKALYQWARCLSSSGEKEKAIEQYALVEKEASGHSYADDARLRAAEIHADNEDREAAARMLAEVPKRYPQGDMLGEALWRLAFMAIEAEEWPKAHHWLDENLRLIPREDVWYAEGRALYWKAQVYRKQGAQKDALSFYKRAITEYPLSVYALLAFERLRQVHPQTRRALLTELRKGFNAAATAKWRFSPRPIFGQTGFTRAVELARLGLGSEARRELARLGISPPGSRRAARTATAPDGDNEDVYWITAILLDRGRSWAAAHAIPRYSLKTYREDYPQGLLAAKWRLAYPRAFPEIVSTECRRNRVPEALQLAIMREESSFNERIESFANALGLTQMLVTTARRFSNRPVSRETLLDPAKNVAIGSRFLSFLLDRYSGLAPLSVAGYNAGEHRVDAWLRERGDLELDYFLETIPFDETRGYTKRVLASYMTYAWLYDSKQPIPKLSFSLKPPRQHAGRPSRRSQKSRRPR